MAHEPVLSLDAPAPIGPYSQAVRIGNELYCSGQIALDPHNGEVVTGDVMDHRTEVTNVIIDGVPQSLESRHTRLYREFKDRP